ncbi:MAG: hypothetical protein WB523_05860, partial [Candidatus Sulfotelmatobacter sp.]
CILVEQDAITVSPQRKFFHRGPTFHNYPHFERYRSVLKVTTLTPYSDKGIGDLLNVGQEVRHHIGENSIGRHLTDILDKLGLSTRGELALFAVKNLGGGSPGSIDPDAPVRAPLKPKPHMRSGGVMAVPEHDDPKRSCRK